MDTLALLTEYRVSSWVASLQSVRDEGEECIGVVLHKTGGQEYPHGVLHPYGVLATSMAGSASHQTPRGLTRQRHARRVAPHRFVRAKATKGCPLGGQVAGSGCRQEGSPHAGCGEARVVEGLRVQGRQE